MSGLRIAFMGTPDFACPSLAALCEAGHRLVLVATQPDRPCGRGQRLKPPAVKVRACLDGLPLVQPERIDTPEFRAEIEALAPEAVVVVAFGQKIPGWLLSLPKYGCINVHASLLPRYRGAAPIQRAIMAGEAETGVSIMRLDEGWDTGPVILHRSLAIGPEEDAGSLHDRLADLGAQALLAALTGLAAGELSPVPQDSQLATTAPKVRPEECRIDWNQPAARLRNLIRALSPAPLAETYHRGNRLQIIRAAHGPGGGREPGAILGASPDGLLVQAGDDAVLLREVKPANGRAMPAWAYAQGRRIEVGERLGDTDPI